MQPEFVENRFVGGPGVAPVRVVSLPTEDEEGAHDDAVAVEAPLEVRIGGRPVAVLMRTPGDDEELVVGFLFGEGVIADADDILSIEEPAGLTESERGNVLDVRLCNARRPPPKRFFLSAAGCGVCGKPSLASLEIQSPPVSSRVTVSREALSTLPERLRAAQLLFTQTGGVHASGLFTPSGELVAVREDVGRHNALDKLVGWALGEGRVPLSERVLLESGRLSYELLQKAVAAGIPVVAGVGAPSSLAIDLAERFNVTLIGFLRPTRMNVYANPARVAAG